MPDCHVFHAIEYVFRRAGRYPEYRKKAVQYVAW